MSDDIEEFRLSKRPSTVLESGESTTGAKKTVSQNQRFIRGPIRLPWLMVAAALPGKAPLLVGLALHFQAGLSGSRSGLRLTSKLRKEFRIPDRTARRGVRRLETAKLIDVERKPGRCLVIDILDVP